MQGNGDFVSKIKNKPVLSFFIFAFLFSWIIWILAAVIAGDGSMSQPESQNGGRIAFYFISYIGAFGPSLAAIFVSAILNPLPSNASGKKRWTVFIIFFSVLMVVFFVQYFWMINLSFQFIIPSILLSATIAYVVSSIYHPKQGVAQLMQGLKQISVKNVWLWVAFLLPFAWEILGALIDLAFGGTDPFSFTLNSLGLLIINYPFILLFGGPLDEEPGWRGFAVPRLQQRFSPLETGLIMGFLWTHWHLPLHFTGFYSVGMWGFMFRFIYNIPGGVLFTWFYNRSKRNLFACIILHTSLNAAAGIFGPTSQQLGWMIMIVFTIIVIFYDKMSKKIQQPSI